MPEGTTDFRSPPVIETVLGVQFDPLPQLSVAHLGAFWQTLGDDWPSIEDAPPLQPEFERFGDERIWRPIGLMRFQIGTKPAARIQIRNAAADRMIQVQNGRFHYNWLGHEGGEYARYKRIRPEFLSRWAFFRKFLRAKQIPEPRPNQWEITYVNHLPQGTAWHAPEDWNRVFATAVAFPVEIPKGRLDSFSGMWRYELEGQRGRLHAELQHGREEREGQSPRELLVFRLTARGPIADQKESWDLERGLDIGHDAIVDGFKALTSDSARNYWEEYR